MIPAGRYIAKAVPIHTEIGPVSAQFGRSKNKGTPQVLMHLRITDGPEANTVMAWAGFFPDGNIVSQERTVAALRLMGFTGDDLADLPNQPMDKPVSITVEHEEYNGKVDAKIKWINEATPYKLKDAMAGAELKTFAAGLKSVLAGAKTEPPATGPDDDRLSF